MFYWLDANNKGTYCMKHITKPDNYNNMLKYAELIGEEELITMKNKLINDY